MKNSESIEDEKFKKIKTDLLNNPIKFPILEEFSKSNPSDNLLDIESTNESISLELKLNIPLKHLLNKPNLDIKKIEEEQFRSIIAKRDFDQNQKLEQQKRNEDSFWQIKNIIAWILIICFILLMIWSFSLGI